ncbi:DinB family protein [Pseudomonas sp. WHRI 8822A]|uniref:DinB family protein n=1 Tax=Pseudomonas sp. WHRI 8822A TaxID=3162568 RepID=UPI0032EC7968
MLSREEAIFHLVNHGTYHRGAIGHALDRAEGSRPADLHGVYPWGGASTWKYLRHTHRSIETHHPAHHDQSADPIERTDCSP